MTPVLAVAGTPATLGRARPLLAVLAHRVQVVSWRRAVAGAGPRPDAVLATEVGLLDELDDLPVAAWVDDAAEAATAADHGARAVLASRSVGHDGSVRVVSPMALDLDAVRPTAPLVRGRRRSAAGLLPVLVAVPAPGQPIPPELLPVASAVVAGADDIVVALAHGAPVVTTAEVAADLGLTAGAEVEVAAADQARTLALRLALDPARAAARSAAGRRFAEEHLDLAAVADDLVVDLDLGRPAPSGLATLDRRLAELATPADGWLRAHLAPATDLLASPPRSAAPMAEPAAHPAAPGLEQRLRALVVRLLTPVRARVRSEIERAVAHDQADLRSQVAELRAEVDRLRAEREAERAVRIEELLAEGDAADASDPAG